MSSTGSGYGSLREVKRRLNLSDTEQTSDPKIGDYINEADNFINTQISLHALTPITAADAELTSLASSLAAAIFNYWQTPIKDRNLDGITSWKASIQNHLMAAYGRKSANGLGGGSLFGRTTGFAPRS